MSQRREDIRRRFFGDPLRVKAEAELSNLMDEVITAALIGAGVLPSGCAVLASGGYGRGTLHPKSDLDFLILFRSNPEEAIVGQVLEAIGSPRFEVGYQVKSLAAFDHFDAREVEGYAAFFEARYLAGDQDLAHTFTSDTFPGFVAVHRAEFVRAMIEARVKRVSSSSSGAVEPNLKLDPGGLRDYHFVLWVSAIAGVAPPDDAVRAAELLHRIRNFLHYLSDRDENVLREEYQPEIAMRLGLGSNTDLLNAYRASADILLGCCRHAEVAACGSIGEAHES